MRISLIVSYGKNFGIGISNSLPWKLPSDLKNFKKLTMGKTVIIGRKTFLSIRNGLPGRMKIVLSNNKNLELTEGILVNSNKEAMLIAKKLNSANKLNEIFIIGGEKIYKQFIDLASRLYITEVNYEGPFDTFFPQINNSQWIIKYNRFAVQEKGDQFSYNYKILVRKKDLIQHNYS